jgi:bifunctional pyridoxal-dependent enzyme with beta-cystathionase and maltose regulon repressor activities
MGDDLFNSATIENMANKPRARWTRDPPGVIPLWLADTDFGVPEEIKAAVIAAVENENTFYNFYDKTAEEAMAAKVTRLNNVEATAEDILVTPGVMPGMWMALKHACTPGDNAVITNPMYDPFKHMTTNICGFETVEWGLDVEEGYRFDPDGLNEAINDRTRLIFVCNPHNPCGRAMTEEELKGVADIAVDNQIVVMVDELWEDVVFDGRPHVSLASLSPEIEALTMTEYGFSKSYGVAGLQVAYLCATNKEMMADIRKKSRHVFHGATNPSKASAPVMLDDTLDWWRKAQMEHLTKIRGLCEKRLGEIPGVHLPKLEGTYLMYPKFDYGMTSQELNKHMFEEARVSLAVGTNYGSKGEGHLRMGIATSEAIMDEALDRISDALEKLR